MMLFTEWCMMLWFGWYAGITLCNATLTASQPSNSCPHTVVSTSTGHKHKLLLCPCQPSLPKLL